MIEVNKIVKEQKHLIRKKLSEIKTIEDIAKLINNVIYSIITTDKIAFAIIEKNILKSVNVIGKRTILDLNLDEPSINSRAIKTKKTQIVYDTREDLDYYPGTGPNHTEMRSELCVPITYEGQVLGTINLESEQPHNYTHKDAQIIQTLIKEIEYTVHTLLEEQPTETPPPSTTKRSPNDIYIEILRAIKDGETRKTRICNAVNVSGQRGTKILQQLESKGNITIEQETPNRKKYKITQQGLTVLQAYDKLITIL